VGRETHHPVSSMALLTDIQRTWLQWLHDNGGSGWVDRYGRLVANGDASKQGTMVTWLQLLQKGQIHVQNERFVLTEQGHRTLGVAHNG
jgi:hypothetical protein